MQAAHMIDRDAPEVSGLGPKVERPKPKLLPEPVEVAPGIWRDPDGRMRTDIPPPPVSTTRPTCGYSAFNRSTRAVAT